MTHPFRMCVVGAGAWFQRMHRGALRRLIDTGQVVCAGVCDLDPSLAESTGRALDAEAVYTDARQMLTTARPDGVALVVKTAAADGLMGLAAQLSVPFLVEKPPAGDTESHRRLIDVVGDLAHVVGYNRRHAPCVAEAVDWMAGQNVQLVLARFARHRRRGEDFSTTASHAIDTARVFAGGRFVRLDLAVERAGEVFNFYVDGHARGGARIELAVMPDVARAQERYRVESPDRSAEVSFPHGHIEFGPWLLQLEEDDRVATRRTSADYGTTDDDRPLLAGIVAEHEALIRAVRENRPADSTLTDCLQTQLVREALSGLARAGGGETDMELDH